MNKVWDWRDWRPHSLNKHDDLMMDDEMRTRLGKIGIGMIGMTRKEMKEI